MWRSSSPAVSRWNSFSSSTSVCSGPLSVMDILNLWDDDPEEVLLDLGFGCEEPDLSGRIPARFINHQSQARGINLQLFLEAQKSRLDLENPDVSNRFRQLEVLQQVTTAFSCLVGSSSTLRAPQGQDLPPDARERRARVAMLLRRASKKALSQIHNHQTQDLTIPSDTSPPCAAPEALQPSPSLGDEKVLKRVKPALLETVCVSHVAEEQGDGDPQQQQALSCQSGRRTESPNSERPGPSPSPPHTLLLSSPLTPSGDDKSLPTALCPSPEPTLVFAPSPSPESPKCDLEMLETKTQPYQDLSPPASLPVSKKCDYLPPSSSSPQLQNTSPYQTQTLTSISSSDSLPPPSLGDEKVLKRVKPAFSEIVCVGPVAEEQRDGDLQQQLRVASLIAQEGELRPWQLSEADPLTANSLLCSRKKSPGQEKELFEMEEALSCQSGRRTESPNSERPGPSPSPPHTLLLSSPLTPSGDDKSLPTALCPSPEPTLVFAPSPSPESPKCDLEMLKTKTQPYQDLSPPASLPASKKCDYLPPSSSSPQLQNTSPYQTQTLTSISSSDSLPPLSAPMQPASLINESELNKTEDRAAPPPHCCTLFHDSVAVSSVPPPASFPSSLHNLDDRLSATMSSTQIDSTSLSPEDTQSEWNGMASCENSLPISTGLSSLVPSPYYSNPSAPVHFNSPYSSVSLSQNLKNNQKDSLFQDSGGMGFSDQPNDTQKQKGCVRLPCLSLNSSTPDGQSPDLDLGKMSYLAEQSISHHDRCSNNENEEPAPASPVQDSIHVKMDHSSLDLEDTLQSNGTAEVGGESHTDTVQTSSGLSDGYLLVSKKICKETEIDPQLPSCIFRDGLSAETIQREIQFCQMEMKGRESESSRSSSVLHDEVVGAHCKSEIEPKDLIEIENIDMVFQTSVDSSEGDEEDVEKFVQQLETERLVYWAEPIQVSDSTYVVDESGTSEDTDVSPGSFILPRGPDSLDSFVSTYTSSKTMDTVQTSGNATAYLDTTSSLTLAPFQSVSIIPDLKQSSRSFSVQMSSSPSSHIVNRKDVPYMTNSISPLLSSVFPLDTSTPFRAVQSWKDLQIQRNTITKMLSHGALDTFPSKVSVSTSASETTQRSLSPSLLSNGWQSQCCLSGTATNSCTVSVSEDNGHDEEEQVNNIRNEDEVKLWEVNQKDSMACCCSFDHPCTCCTQKSYNKLHPLGNITDSLDEMGEMMSCLQQFGFVLSHIEKQLSEDQAAVYTSLSDLDREKIRDIEKLRCTVKQETAELEMQLNEHSDHNNDSVKKKMHRLLGEQSLLCSQLRVFVPGMVSPPQRRAPNRTVSTQCCMLPWIEEPPGTHSLCRGLGCSPSKADRLDIVGFLQRLKESFRNSSNTDLFE